MGKLWRLEVVVLVFGIFKLGRKENCLLMGNWWSCMGLIVMIIIWLWVRWFW